MRLQITVESTFHVLSGYYKPGNMDFTCVSTKIHGAAIQVTPIAQRGKQKPRGDSTCPEYQPVSGRVGI